MGNVPYYVTADKAFQILQDGPHPQCAISNDSATTVCLDDSGGVGSLINDWILRPGDRCLWLENKPCWAIAAISTPPTPALLNVSFNVLNFQSTSFFQPNAGVALLTGGTVTTFVGNGVNGILGQTYAVHTFTTPGVITAASDVTVRFLNIGGGAAGNGVDYFGGAGDLHTPWIRIPMGSYTVTPGIGGINTGAGSDRYGRQSIIAGIDETSLAPTFPLGSPFSMDVAAGGTLANPQLPYTSDITGTSQTYGLSNQALPRVNRGDGATNGAGSDGIVIFQIAA